MGAIYNSDVPDLGAFAAAGGRMITWHGLTDAIVPHGKTVAYYEGSRRRTGSTSSAASTACSCCPASTLRHPGRSRDHLGGVRPADRAGNLARHRHAAGHPADDAQRVAGLVAPRLRLARGGEADRDRRSHLRRLALRNPLIVSPTRPAGGGRAPPGRG